MFKSVRIITYISSILLMLLLLAVSVVLKSSFISNQVASGIENPITKVVGNYQSVVWDRYYPVIAFLQDQPTQQWNAFPQFVNFQHESRDLLDIKGLLKADLFINKATKLFDSDDSITIKPQTATLGFGGEKLIRSTDAYNISILETTLGGMKQQDEKLLLKLQYPLKVKNPTKGTEDLANKAQGTLTFYFDLSDFVSTYKRMQYSMLFFWGVVILIVNIAIHLFSTKVEELIGKQQEAAAELVNAKAVAESESKAKSQFLANVSHELRTPLNAIIGFSEIINSESMGPIGNPQYKEFISDINASGVHLLSLINDILDYSKAEENKFTIDFEQVDVTKVIKLCLRMILPRAEAAKVNLKEDVPPEHIMIMADQKRIKQVILNLLTNAVKFTPEDGAVTIKLFKNTDNNTVSIEIKDTGVGMAAQDLARALSPFGQVESKLSHRFEGTGLGLPLTKKLVELMRGKFDIKSETGIGTAIIVTFAYQGNDIEESKPSTPPNS